jgi:dethiobiotin synthetase
LNSLFITGTDTGVGKTIVTAMLAKFLRKKSVNAVTQKWIQTGCSDFSDDIQKHLDIAGLTRNDIKDCLPQIAPYIFQLPASPHLAAELQNASIDPGFIKSRFRSLTRNFDTVLVEGVGGLLVPFDRSNLIVDIAKELSMPALIVAANKLGAINHTLLTIEALKARNMQVLGIVFNSISDDENNVISRDNPKIVNDISGVKILGSLPFDNDTESLYENFIPIGQQIYDQLKGNTK